MDVAAQEILPADEALEYCPAAVCGLVKIRRFVTTLRKPTATSGRRATGSVPCRSTSMAVGATLWWEASGRIAETSTLTSRQSITAIGFVQNITYGAVIRRVYICSEPEGLGRHEQRGQTPGRGGRLERHPQGFLNDRAHRAPAVGCGRLREPVKRIVDIKGCAHRRRVANFCIYLPLCGRQLVRSRTASNSVPVCRPSSSPPYSPLCRTYFRLVSPTASGKPSPSDHGQVVRA